MIGSYLRTLKNYFATNKGRHDILDYIRAVIIIALTAAIITLIIGGLF